MAQNDRQKAASRTTVRSFAKYLASLAFVAGIAAMAHAGGRLLELSAAEPELERHQATDHPRTLSPQRAEEIYRAILPSLRATYARSGDVAALAYSSWARHNTHPYRSSRHGDVFVNNYTNEIAGAYRLYERAGQMPEGALIVKDSFIMTTDGDIQTGSFALMEKMPRGFDPQNGDWRYMLVDGQGEVRGISKAYASERVAFCGECHRKAAPESDHLFFVPRYARK